MENELFVVRNEDDAVSIDDLLSTPAVEEPKLFDPFLPQTGIALLVGKPDCGKSMFARSLCLHVATRATSFLDFPLLTRKGRAIYVATEDGINTTKAVMHKQVAGMFESETERPQMKLEFLFDKGDGPETLLSRLELLLQRAPADLVVIDSYGDMFSGKDANSNSEVRKALIPFYAMADKHQVLILFLTHITKAGYKQSPDQVHVAGGAALVQKARAVMQLTAEETPGYRLLCATKGNGIPDDVKRKAYRLFFDSDSLSYENTSEEVSIDVVGKTNPGGPTFDWEDIFGDKVILSTRELEMRLGKSHQLKPRRARFYITHGLHRVEHGRYTYDEKLVPSSS